MGGEESEKIIRTSDNLIIKDSPDEEKYRSKYLPDPTKLTDEKLVCTVCSAALDQDIHKGRTIFVHRLLHVLVCEGCFNFYGDGCFSADEDGDDKYCRWCGQGGTLYLCSACNCAFCQKCVKQNLKSSVVAELEKDDWKCYFCNPRPLFGCRTICWGAAELNKIGKEKEKERIRKQKERLEKVGAKKKEENGRSRKASTSSEDEVLTKKRKSRQSSDSSSPEVMPKKVKRTSRSLNGNVSRGRKKRNDSESDDSEDNKKVVRQSRSRNNRKLKKESDSSSGEDSDAKTKRKKSKIKRKKAKGTSDESSDEDKKKPKAKNRSKKKVESSDDSSDEKSTNKKKKLKKKKYDSTSEESDDDKKKSNKSKQKKKKDDSSDEDSDDDSNKKSTKKVKDEKDSKKKDDKVEENKSKSDSKENKTSSHEDALVKKRIKLAIMWLGTALKDISELGNLISVRAAKFSTKKINADNLKTYDDVLTTVAKLRQLITGVHSNYNHIEKTLDSQLKPWKILTGLEDPDNEKPAEEVKAPEDSVAEGQESDNKDEPNIPDNSEQKPAEEEKGNDENNDMQLRLSEEMLSPDDDSENDQSTRDAVAKASEVLEKDQESENNQVNEGGNETALNNSLSNDICNKSLQQDNSQSEPDDVRSDESNADAKNKTPKKSGYKSLLGSSKKKDQAGENTAVKESNKSVVEDSDSEGVTGKDSNKSVINDSDSEDVTGVASKKSPVEDVDSDGGEELSVND